MISAEHKERLHSLIESGVADALNKLKEEAPVEEKPDFTTVIETNDNDAPEDSPSGEVMKQVQEEVEKEEAPVVEVPVEAKVDIEPDATPQEVEQAVQKDLEQKHEAVEVCDNEETDLITKLRHILIKDFGKSEALARKYPKQDKMGMYLYYDSAHIRDKGYKREKYAPYNAIIDQLNGTSTERLENIANEQKERREAYKSVEKAFENGAEITQEQAKEVAKAKAIDETNVAYNNATNESFDKAELEISKPLAQTSKDLKANKGKGVYTDLEQYKDQLLQDNIKLEQALNKAEAAGNENLKANLMVTLINNVSKLDSLNVDIEKEKKEFARIARMSAINEAIDEQEENNLDSLVLNGQTYKCKTAIIKEDDWRDLTRALDNELIDESTGRDKGYCNMYNSIMLRRLVTHYVIKQFGSTKKITKIYVNDMHLYVNDTLVLYQGDLFSPKSVKRIPKDVLPYFKNGMLAPFFDWGIFYKGIHCGGRPTNLRTLAFDSTEYLADYFASDITDMHECRKKDVVKSPYSYMNPDLYFTLFQGLVNLTLGGNTYDRQEWEEQKADEDSPMMRTMHQRMQREKRRINLLDGYKLDVYTGTNGFQKFGIGCFTNYVKNRGNKGFLRFALGSSMRFVLAGAGIVTNLGAHLIGGIYHSLKSDTEYDWNDNIKDKMNKTSDAPVTAKDTEQELKDAEMEAAMQAEGAE